MNSGDIRQTLLETLRQVILRILETESWKQVTCDPIQRLPAFQLTQEVCGIVQIHGVRRGIVAVTASRRTTAAIISAVTGSEVREMIDEDILDGIAELANMVCGNMKTYANIGGITLTPPMAILGGSFVAQWKTEHPVHQLTFRGRDHTLIVLASV
ncbi:MAG: chemotaxis protein CheX [Magnetococcales bacterium]|nr:chemotaxis protein CheX [Magnetococcales bacterium]